MRLGMNFIEVHSQKDFTWGRASALSRMAQDKDEISNILANANREAKKLFHPPLLINSQQLRMISKKIQRILV